MKKLSEQQEWLLKLDQERWNVSNRLTEPERVFIQTPAKCRHKPYSRCAKPHVSDDRDKLFFNAGRYAAGARDKTAVQAWWKVMKG